MEPVCAVHTVLPILKCLSEEVLGRKSEPLNMELVPLEFRFHIAWDGELRFKHLGVDPAAAPDPFQSEIRNE